MKNHTGKLVIAAIALALVGSFAYAHYAGKKANEGVTVETRVLGNPDAETVLVEYSDFECPACAQFHPYVKEVIAEHGDDLRFEYRHFPLINIHPTAVAAAHAAEAAAQQDKFFEMHDILFERQGEWARSGNPKAHFIEYARELGLDEEQFTRQMDASIIDDGIMASFNEARSQGFTGTPTFVLNGERMEFETFDEFRQQIADAVGTTTVETAE